MSAKAAWKASLDGYVKATSKSGRVPKPIQTPSSSASLVSDPQSIVPDLNSQQNQSQVDLLKAVIDSQKRTIASFQEDLVHSYGKIAKTQSELKKCKEKLANQSDYHDLKARVAGGYAMGFDAGQIKACDISLVKLKY